MPAQIINKGGASGFNAKKAGEVGVVHPVGVAVVAGESGSALSLFPPFPSLFPPLSHN